MRNYLRFVLLLFIGVLVFPTVFAQGDSSTDPLVRVLVTKGVLTPEEGRLVTNGPPAGQRDRLAALLRHKGVISSDGLESVRTNPPAAPPALAMMNADYKTPASEAPSAAP